MKIFKLLSILLIVCILLGLCSCVKTIDEESASSDQLVDDNEQQPETAVKPETDDTEQTKQDEEKPKEEPQENPKEEPEEETEDTNIPEPNKNQNSQETDKMETENNKVSLPETDTSKKVITSRNDIPLGESASLFVESGDDAYTAVFNNSDVNFAKKYILELKKEGYQKYSETSFDGMSDSKKNMFATYQSDDYYVDLGHHSYNNRLYVTFTPKTDGLVLPNLEKPIYKDCKMPTIITQVGAERFHKTAVSMCYVIRAADGSFIVYDSDFGDGMAELIYDILKKQAPDPNNIVISAWFVTHPHMDHVGAFIDFADKYADDKTITLKQMVYNYPEDTYITGVTKDLMTDTPIAAKKLNENVTFVRAHAGNVLYYADLTFRILYTEEEYLAPTSGKIEDVNGASIVSQLKTDSGVKILLGADHPVNGSYQGLSFCEGALYNWYGSFIESEIVTLFHHGFGGGADLEVYKFIKPKVVLWPATFYRLTHDSDGTPYSNIEFNERNLYFSDPQQARKNGVKGYYISGDKIHIVDLSNKKLTVTEYKTCDEYLK